MNSGLLLTAIWAASQATESGLSSSSVVQLVGAVGIGALLGSLISNGVTIWSGYRQRNHELVVRQLQFRHELRMNRLERLQQDFADLMLALHDIRQAVARFVADRERVPETQDMALDTAARQQFQLGRERFEISRARLVLDADGARFSDLVADLTAEVSRYDELLTYNIHAREMNDLGDEVDISAVDEEVIDIRRGLVRQINELTEDARQVLQAIASQPLDA